MKSDTGKKNQFVDKNVFKMIGCCDNHYVLYIVCTYLDIHIVILTFG